MTALPNIDLNDLRSDDVAQNLAEIAQRVQEAHPEIDVKRGVLHDLLLLLHAELSTQHKAQLDRYLRARSLQQIVEDPDGSLDVLVDDVLSNYNVTRRAGSQATGDVTIVLSRAVSTTIGSGAVFTANGKRFTSDAVFSAKTESSQVVDTNDRLLQKTSDGYYAFTITVTAEANGESSQLPKDTLIVPVSPPASYVTSYAASDFTGGRLEETNSEMMTRLQEGIAAPVPSNRVNMQSWLRQQFSDVVNSAIVGYGDPEMLRDQHSIFPLSLGGRVDWYVRSKPRMLVKTLSLDATLMEKHSNGSGTWQVAMVRDTAPGFYEVDSVRLPSATNLSGGFNVISDARDTDLTDLGFTPDIETIEEGAYTRFQTAMIRFVDTETDHGPLIVGAVKTYDVAVKMMPQIDVIQDAVNSRDNRSYGADVLIKAPVPCFVQLSLTLFKQNTAASPDLDAIKAALADEVNAVPFVGRLYASHLHDVIHDLIDADTSVGSIDMFGRIRRPDGHDVYLRDQSLLRVPDDPQRGVSYRTVQFFTSENDIAVSVSAEVPTA